MTELFYDTFGRSLVLPGVYSDFAHVCKLVHVLPDNSRVTQELADEPVGWGNARFKIFRGELHGVSHEYTLSDSALEFNGESGRDFVGSIFGAEGEDATVLFQYCLRIPAIVDPVSHIGVPGYDLIEYEGRLNLSLRKVNQRRISAGLERNTLQSRVMARWETALNLAGSRSLDNVQIVPPIFPSIPLTAQSLDERFVNNVLAGKRVEQNFQGDTNGHLWLQFDTSNPQVSEIETFGAGQPAGLSEGDGPVLNDQYLFKFRSAGVRTVKISVGYKLDVAVKKRTISVGPARITGYQQFTKLVLVSADNATKRQEWDITTPLADGLGKRPPRTSFGETGIQLILDGTLEVDMDTKSGDKLFLYGLNSFTHNKNELQQTQVVFSVVTFRMTVSGKSKNSASSVRCLPVGVALSTALTLITGLSDRFRSNFYNRQSVRYPVNGCGSERVLFNGFAARQFKAVERPLTISMQDLVLSLNAMDCTGLAFGHELVNNEPVEIVQMEPVQHFYRPVELLRLDEVGDYKEESIASELYSTVEVGYQSYVSDGAGSLEEVFTEHQVTTPIKHETAKRTITSKLIASSLAIERTRREQFADTPKDGTTYDESVFIVQCKPTSGYTGPATLSSTIYNTAGLIAVPTAITWLTKGQKITIGGTASSNGEYTVTFVSDMARKPWTFLVSPNTADEVVQAITITPVGGLDLQPETGADFESVSGLLSPGDTYNLRLTPARMLWANVPVWAGCLINKDKYKLINKQAITETGLIQLAFQSLSFFQIIITNTYVPWLAAGMTVTITGSASNNHTFTVLAVSPADYQPWGFFVKEAVVPEIAPLANVSFVSIANDDLYAAVNKTKIPNNKSVVTVLPVTDACGKPGRVAEAAPIGVDQLIPDLLYLPRLIKFKQRLTHDQIQRLRLGHTGLLPSEIDPITNLPVDRNYGYVSLLNESGIRVAGYVSSVEYSRDEAAIFELRQTALDLNDTTSGLDCGQFAGWTLRQAMDADERTRRRLELCRFIDVDPL